MRIIDTNTSRKRWTWLAAGAVAALGLALSGSTIRPAAAQPAPTPAPSLPELLTEPVLPRPGIRWMGCEDPAAQRINFTVVSRNRPGGLVLGRVRITGVVKNAGSAAYISGPRQQSILLYEDARLVASAPFQNLAVGQEVRVSFVRDWYSGWEFPPTYRLIIAYDPDIYLDGNPNNDDCNAANNSLSRSGFDVQALFR
jgi:hypothetical protein